MKRANSRIAAAIVLTLLCLMGFAPTSRAGVVVIGTLHPSTPQGVTPGFFGLAFDGTPNPLIIDRWSWSLSRVSLQDASVLSVTPTAPVPSTYNSQLAFDATTGDFFTVASNTSLARISGGTWQNAAVGSGLGEFFNFVGLTSDAGGNLWLASDRNSGELWTVNKLTGVGAVQTAVQLPINYQLTSLMIDAAGNFIVYGRSMYVGMPSYFFNVDPNTGATSIVAEGWSDPFSTITTMAYDPATKGYYGILTLGGSGFNQLVEITGVPEPSSYVLAVTGLLGLAGCRYRKTVGAATNS